MIRRGAASAAPILMKAKGKSEEMHTYPDYTSELTPLQKAYLDLPKQAQQAQQMARQYGLAPPMTGTQAARDEADRKMREEARRQALADGANAIWGENRVPTCATCPLYVARWGSGGVCLRTDGPKNQPINTRRERQGCQTHPEIAAVLEHKRRSAMEDLIARKINQE